MFAGGRHDEASRVSPLQLSGLREGERRLEGSERRERANEHDTGELEDPVLVTT